LEIKNKTETKTAFSKNKKRMHLNASLFKLLNPFEKQLLFKGTAYNPLISC
jgi:hypothetical protein